MDVYGYWAVWALWVTGTYAVHMGTMKVCTFGGHPEKQKRNRPGLCARC